ncbi:MAG: hypothetical protein LV471_06415 [Nitrosomonas sp.]|nr:hypothetical protein [Nitrosomonas sp.]
MKMISARQHGYLDYLTVGIFLLAPTVLSLSQMPAMLAYILAGVHLMVTLATDFPLGIFKLLSFTLHGWIERIVGPTLLAVPFILSFAEEPAAMYFYLVMGATVILLGLLTDYRDAQSDTGQ